MQNLFSVELQARLLTATASAGMLEPSLVATVSRTSRHHAEHDGYEAGNVACTTVKLWGDDPRTETLNQEKTQ